MRGLLIDGKGQIGPNGPILFDPAVGAPCCCGGSECEPPVLLADCREWRHNDGGQPDEVCSINGLSRAVVTLLRIVYTGPDSDTNGILALEMVGESTPLIPSDHDILGHQTARYFAGGVAQVRITTRLGIVNAQVCLSLPLVGSVFTSFLWVASPTPIVIPLLGGGTCTLQGLIAQIVINGQGCGPQSGTSTLIGFPCGAPGVYNIEAAYRIDGLIAGPCGEPPPPPPPPEGACCVGQTCAKITAESCANVGGTYMGDGVQCTTGLCVTAPPPQGACCPADGTGRCLIATADDCHNNFFGRFLGGLCTPNRCGAASVGMCCIDNGEHGCFDGDTEARCEARRVGFESVNWSPFPANCADNCGHPGPGVVGFA